MEIKQRKVCGSCKCLRIDRSMLFCELGYEFKPKRVFDIEVNGVPQEPCPKPLTNGDYYRALNNYKKR